jgi:hypothetical protein
MHTTNYVLVLDTHRNPLAPCHPARARELLKKGKAAVFRRYPFTIILYHTPKGPINTNFEIRIDPGSKTTGIAVISKGKRGHRCIIAINLEHRGATIHRSLQQRAAIRRTRRARKTRYRAPRFLNRTRPKGWLPPSVQHRVTTTLTWIDRLMRYCPITSSRIETVSFDTHALQNPTVVGKGYQQGPLFRTQMRHYLLTVHNGTCQYCHGASGDFKLEWEHIVPKSQGGSDSVTNATLACHSCNTLKGDYAPHVWLHRIQAYRPHPSEARYYQALKRYALNALRFHRCSLKDAAVMNATRYRIQAHLDALGLHPQVHPGWLTAYNRKTQRYRKEHWIDAACIGATDDRVYIPPSLCGLHVRATGHHSRQMQRMDRYGFPRTAPKGSSRVQGFSTGDCVRACIPTGRYAGIHQGRVAVRTSGQFSITGASKQPINAPVRTLDRLQAKDGYAYAFEQPRTRTFLVDPDNPLAPSAIPKQCIMTTMERPHVLKYTFPHPTPNHI